MRVCIQMFLVSFVISLFFFIFSLTNSTYHCLYTIARLLSSSVYGRRSYDVRTYRKINKIVLRVLACGLTVKYIRRKKTPSHHSYGIYVTFTTVFLHALVSETNFELLIIIFGLPNQPLITYSYVQSDDH